MKRFLVLLFLLPTLTYAQGAGTPPYRGVNNWNLIFGTDNVFDIGANAAQRPRTGYFGTSVITPALTVSGLTATRVPFAGSGGLISDAAGLTWDGTSLSATRHTTAAADNCTSPPYSFGADTDTGMCSSVADAIVFRTAGSNRFTINSAGLNAPAGSNIILSDSSVFSAGSLRLSTDTTIAREAAAIFQLGLDVNGSTVAYTLKSGDGITGTNIAGAALTLAGGRGTGSAAPGDYIEQTATPLASGTTAQTLVTRARHVAPFRALADATATTVFTVGIGNDISCGGTMFFTVEAADAANQQATSGSVNFSAADNAAGAGGEACSAAVTGTNSSAATSGTLTVTADATTGTDLCNIRLTATGSLTETVGPRVRYSLVLNPMSSSCTVTPQ